MIFKERLLGEAGIFGHVGAFGGHGAERRRLYLRSSALHVTGNELEFRIVVTGTALIDDAHPSAHIDVTRVGIGAGSERQIVVSPPCHAAGLIADASRL